MKRIWIIGVLVALLPLLSVFSVYGLWSNRSAPAKLRGNHRILSQSGSGLAVIGPGSSPACGGLRPESPAGLLCDGLGQRKSELLNPN